MSTSKGKKRAPSLIGSTTATTAVVALTVLAKNTFPRVKAPDTFLKNRKKFKAYETECRIYFWADAKRGDWRNLKIIVKQVIYASLKLRGKAFSRFEPYIT
jgi:hypothetical protein